MKNTLRISKHPMEDVKRWNSKPARDMRRNFQIAGSLEPYTHQMMSNGKLYYSIEHVTIGSDVILDLLELEVVIVDNGYWYSDVKVSINLDDEDIEFGNFQFNNYDNFDIDCKSVAWQPIKDDLLGLILKIKKKVEAELNL